MNFCSLKEIEEIPFTYPDNNAIFMDNSRDFTMYETSNYWLQKFASKYSLQLNSNEFRLFLQKNPTKLLDFINYYKSKNIIYLS
jgi:hypothetical protein